jgi:hypothetical protein
MVGAPRLFARVMIALRMATEPLLLERLLRNETHASQQEPFMGGRKAA